MKNSIFGKFIVGVMVIVVLGFTIMTTSMLTLAGNYSRSVREEAMYYLAERCALTVNSQHFNKLSSLDRNKTFENLALTADGSVLILLNKYGTVSCHSKLPQSGLGTLSEDYLERIAKNDREGISFTTLGGLFNERYTVVPACFYDNSGNFAGAVLACTRSGVDGVFILQVLFMTLVSGALGLLIIFIITYFLTRRFVEPLRQMSRAAKQIANGNFDVKLEVKGKDELAQLSEALNDMARALSKNEKERSGFLANVAHDLRTPMTSIAGFIDGIIDGVIPADKHNYYLTIVTEEIKRLSALVNKLMEISRYEAGDRKLVMSRFDICEMLKRILIGFEQKIEKRGIEIEFLCDSGKRYFVTADTDAIYQVCYNLIDNAVKFINQGGRLSINIADIGKKYAISVKNTGDGISEEDLPKIFDRFYKADKSRGLDKTGTGLGMFIAKTVMNTHGETITADSVFGEYAKFEFTLPKA